MEVTFEDLSLSKYIKDLGSAKPTPGGGSSAAFTGVIACSLLTMACTITHANMEPSLNPELVQDTIHEVLTLKEKLEDLVIKDIDAFNQTAKAYKMPKKTDEEKQARSDAIQKALIPCTDVPIKILKLCAQGIDLCSSLDTLINKNVISDLGCAVTLFVSAMKSAWLNIKINLSMRKDDTTEIEKSTKQTLDYYLSQAAQLYSAVEAVL